MKEIKCRYCKRYLFTAVDTVIAEQVPCGNSKCRAKLNIKIVDSNSTLAQLQYKFDKEEVVSKLKTVMIQ